MMSAPRGLDSEVLSVGVFGQGWNHCFRVRVSDTKATGQDQQGSNASAGGTLGAVIMAIDRMSETLSGLDCPMSNLLIQDRFWLC